MSYFAATRHPWAGLVFLLPLLAAYELGVAWLGGPNALAYRNGADAWLRWLLGQYGVLHHLAAPLMIITILLIRSALNWSNRPQRMFAVLFGMLLESGAFALLLWLISRNFTSLLGQMGVTMQLPPPSPQVASIITFVGAGIYEEVVFRLVLFSACVFVLRLVLLPAPVAVLIGAVLAALAFAAAHHAGPHGEWPIVPQVFAFRFVAGLFFTALYVFRGFGVAVGAHAGYDVLAGVVLTPEAA